MNGTDPPFSWKPSANLWECSCHPPTRHRWFSSLLARSSQLGGMKPTFCNVSEHSPTALKVGIARAFNPKIIVVATTGWRFQLIGRESAQLDQCAESRDLLALLNPTPLNDKRMVMHCFAFAEKFAIPIMWASTKAVNCGLTDRNKTSPAWLFWSSRPLPLGCTQTCSMFESCHDGLRSPPSFGVPLPKFCGWTLSGWQIKWMSSRKANNFSPAFNQLSTAARAPCCPRQNNMGINGSPCSPPSPCVTSC